MAPQKEYSAWDLLLPVLSRQTGIQRGRLVKLRELVHAGKNREAEALMTQEEVAKLDAVTKILQGKERLFAEAWYGPNAIDRRAVALAKRLRAKATQLGENHAFERGFRRRLARTWHEAFTLYEIVLVCATEAGSNFNQAHRKQAAKENDLVFEALTHLHAQACRVAGEAFELLQGGYPHGAHARWRTLHELAVFASIIGDHGDAVAERFLLHDAVENAQVAESYQARLGGRHGYEPISSEEMARINKRRDAAIARFGKKFEDRYGWAIDLVPGKPKPGFLDLEALASLEHLHPFYDWSTHLAVHASSRGARLNLFRLGNEQVLLAGRTNAGLAEPGHGSLISLMQVTTTLLIKGRPIGIDSERLVVLEALHRVTTAAGDAFLAAHRKLEEKEARFQRLEAQRLTKKASPRTQTRSTL